jgi:periplasmic copper chaperone A
MLRGAAWLAVLLLNPVFAQDGHDVRAGTLVVSDAWTRPTAAGMPMGVAYFIVRNTGASADTLVAASTPAAARVEFHQTTFDGGMARMRPLREIAVPANGVVAVAPGGIHLMLVDLRGPLAAGTRVPLVLEFRNAGRVEIRLTVESRKG